MKRIYNIIKRWLMGDWWKIMYMTNNGEPCWGCYNKKIKGARGVDLLAMTKKNARKEIYKKNFCEKDI